MINANGCADLSEIHPESQSYQSSPHSSSSTTSSPSPSNQVKPSKAKDELSKTKNDNQIESDHSFDEKFSNEIDTKPIDLDQSASISNSAVPSNSQLLDAILPIRSTEPTLGVPKLLIKLKQLNPSWQLSEKRLRKFLNSNPNISPQATRHHSNPSTRLPSEPIWLPDYAWEKDWEAASAEHASTEPISSLDNTLLLECRQRSVKVEPVRFPANNKGSGLISKDHIAKSTQIIKEDAFVWVPPNKNMSRSIISGRNCAFCGRAFSVQRTKSQTNCPHHPVPGSKEAIAAQQLVSTTFTSLATGTQSVTEKPAGPEPCYMRYCTRVCAQKSVDYFGPLVCPQKNPEYMQLIRFTDAEEFRGAHLVFKLFARMLIANEAGDISLSSSFKPNQPLKSLNHSKLEQNGSNHNVEIEPDPAGSDDPTTVGNKKTKKSKSKKKVVINSVPESTPPSVEFEKIVDRIKGLATISDRARRERFHGGGHLGSHFTDVRYGQMWRNGWHTVIRALHINTGYRPRQTTGKDNSTSTDAFWDTFWKRRLDSETIAHYFGLKSFLEFIGMTSLNREADHGLYLLHSRFNHSCEPNAIVLKHPGSEDIHKSAPSTIYVISRREIAKDEEITLSYVNPEMPLESRRKKLFEDYLFSCFCSRCRRELKEEAQKVAPTSSILEMTGNEKEVIHEIKSDEVSSFSTEKPNIDQNRQVGAINDENMMKELQEVFS
ncbi:hypothetical protein O181_014222 [Austropuccinia psidii MF-1]|uniref:Histone-lysine N-methyltransferase SET5 n=1 Tax=Austropuccinia psidii MF-1 TaxID=1389203 RepID=A0A9Q3GPN0_9BASI|nr:hypothetical protein [Austropuccinia psidii MF-1]